MSGDSSARPPVQPAPAIVLVFATIAMVAQLLYSGFPDSPREWTMLAVAAICAALCVPGAILSLRWVLGKLGGATRRIAGFAGESWRKLAAAVTIVVVLGVLAGGALMWYDNYRFERDGCPHPAELRVLASAGTLRPVQRAADEYERSVAKDRRECPTASLFVYSASTLDIREALRGGWPDETLVRWPRPDVWIADSGIEVSDVYDTPPPWMRVNEQPLVSTPLVLAVPQPESAALATGLVEFTWSELWRRVYQDEEWDVLRPEPAALAAGRIATAAIYQSVIPDLADGEAATELERHFAASAERGRYLTTDVDSALCQYRARLGIDPVTAAILTEQEVAEYNAGSLGVGARCGRSTTRLVAFYPTDTLRMERQLVQLDWGDADTPQATAAAEFGEWLYEADGWAAMDTSLDAEYAANTRVHGDVPTSDQVTAADELHRQAIPNGRMLVLLDTSGSMDEPAGPTDLAEAQGSTRMAVATAAVLETIRLMIPGDAYGLWTFPGPDGAVDELVPVTVADDPAAIDRIAQSTGAALGRLSPDGPTPLHAALMDGVQALRGNSDGRRGALVVITDGADSGGGPSAGALREEAVVEGGPAVFMIAVGEAYCTDQLEGLTLATGGSCYRSHIDDLPDDLRRVARLIWGGDDD